MRLLIVGLKFKMFDQCLKILLIFGLFSAVARGEDATSTIADNYNECYAGDPVCDWKNDPSANQDWSLTSFDGATNMFATFDGYSARGNRSIRAISPIFRRDDNYSCVSISFIIHSESKSGFVGLRVYQKPVHVTLSDLIAYSDEAKKDYILFEVWGDQDYAWHDKEFPLKHFDSNFQIILEGHFGEVSAYIEISAMKLKQTTECTGHTPQTIPNRQTTSTTLSTTTTMSTTTTEGETRENGCDSRNTEMIISLIAILGIVLLIFVCVLAVVLAWQRGTYRLNGLRANIVGTSSFIDHEKKPSDARYSTKNGGDVVIDSINSTLNN